MTRKWFVFMFLAIMHIACTDGTNRSSDGASGKATVGDSVSRASQSMVKLLPRGFMQVEGTQIHPSGWPREIRCLRDNSVMVFVPSGELNAGLDDKQVKALAAMSSEYDPGVAAQTGVKHEIMKQLKPGSILNAEDLEVLKEHGDDGFVEAMVLGVLQEEQADIPADSLDRWRKQGRSLESLLAIPAVRTKFQQDQIHRDVLNDLKTAFPGPELEIRQRFPQPHKVRMPAFYIDEHEITNRQYRKFFDQANDPNRRPGMWFGPGYSLFDKADKFYDLWSDSKRNRDDQPVTCVGEKDALGYAAWVGKQLPTRDQWQRAASGDDGRLFPWGSDFQVGYCSCDVKTWPDKAERHEQSTIGNSLAALGALRSLHHEWRKLREGPVPARVGQFPHDVSPFGCHDMAGNVSEWVIRPNGGTQDDARLVPVGGNAGSFLLPDICPAMCNASEEPGKLVGFRTILMVESLDR